MSFKEWWESTKIGDNTEYTPIIKIDKDASVNDVVFELERLGLYRGNDFSDKGEITNIDIWYKEFYNLFISYLPSDKDIFVTLEELKQIEV